MAVHCQKGSGSPGWFLIFKLWARCTALVDCYLFFKLQPFEKKTKKVAAAKDDFEFLNFELGTQPWLIVIISLILFKLQIARKEKKLCITALQKGSGSPGWFWIFKLWAGCAPPLLFLYFFSKLHITIRKHCCIAKRWHSPGWFWLFYSEPQLIVIIFPPLENQMTCGDAKNASSTDGIFILGLGVKNNNLHHKITGWKKN